ncbi:homeobox-like protein HDP1 [Achroia grisella]|uniref:homeobox-like protein HDP1 n=1 Tax=Achroia grisella TaxID=688607 RepID=UPI0027D3126A|nr:homeobox-like protein HDP1 [Achroia grisella]
MSRCDYNVLFYRVFCLALLVIAFIFTVILTNVFIDIDGLLSRKDKAQSHNTNAVIEKVSTNVIPDDTKPELLYNDDKDYVDEEYSYRSKRSLESQDFLQQIKNPKVKDLLKNRLETLLEELDEEESVTSKQKQNNGNTKFKENSINIVAKNEKKVELDTVIHKNNEIMENNKALDDNESTQIRNNKNEKIPREAIRDMKNDDLLHLAMHNILLQGIIGHMDLNNVYKKLHSLISNFNKMQRLYKENFLLTKKELEKNTPPILKRQMSPPVEENKYFDEITKCDKLQNELTEGTDKDMTMESKNIPQKGINLIKTIIDMSSINYNKNNKENQSNSKDIKGFIKVIFNGNPIRLRRLNSDEENVFDLERNKIKGNIETSTTVVKKVQNDNFGSNNSFESKRIKRHTKLLYDDEIENITKIPKLNEKGVTKDDDELYVEIDTHFDSKGMKGEKKKKLIRNLVDKIQKAILSDLENQDIERKKNYKHLHVKKRTQDPLDNKYNTALLNKAIPPIEAIVHRHLDPISKIAAEDIVPNIYDKSGESWKKTYFGPRFLTETKSLNSAEMGQVDVDYNKVMKVNGISQRIQKPLNTDVSEDILNANNFDMGNMKFFIKDIDGSGFSIGFNQYTDEAPDTEAMKLFTGVEHLIQTYHQKYDELESTTEDNKLIESNFNHNIIRRSIKNSDHHSNEYKIIFNSSFLPYNSYQEIIKDKKKSIKESFNEDDKESLILLDENIFERHLKPAEILTLANLFERNKRAVTVKNISYFNNNIKLNKFLNTNIMTTKRIILNTKRNKRQINKIRIIARGDTSRPKQSQENIFVLSDENILADRPVVREVETPEELEIPDRAEENIDYIPYINDQTNLGPSYTANEFHGRHRHNLLMSKYPHIFMEEMSRSKETITPEEPFLEKLVENIPQINYNEKQSKIYAATENYVSTALDVPISNMDQLDGINSQGPANYKFTVKIMPKNSTSMNSGFKEIHTSINKSFNKNGLRYSSLVNVSEISKIENERNLKQKEEKIKHLLKRHKQRIDAQLNHLKKEKEHLESLIVKNENNSNELVDLILPISPPQTVRMRKDDINKLGASAFLNEQDLQNDIKTTTHSSTTLNFPTTTIQNTKELEKTTIVNIEKNESLTKEILKKIDQNTLMLQMFLEKLTDKFAAMTQPTTIRTIKEELNVPKDWKNYQPIHEPFFGQAMPEIEVRKNDTHVSIPFVYAYQQPFPVVNKADGPNAPVASVVYHGHIHTNAVRNNRETWKQNAKDINMKNNVKVIAKANGSRFFIDDLENEYKVAVPKSVPKNDGIYSKLPVSENKKNCLKENNGIESRPFTNGHGYPFDLDCDEVHDDKDFLENIKDAKMGTAQENKHIKNFVREEVSKQLLMKGNINGNAEEDFDKHNIQEPSNDTVTEDKKHLKPNDLTKNNEELPNENKDIDFTTAKPNSNARDKSKIDINNLEEKGKQLLKKFFNTMLERFERYLTTLLHDEKQNPSRDSSFKRQKREYNYKEDTKSSQNKYVIYPPNIDKGVSKELKYKISDLVDTLGNEQKTSAEKKYDDIKSDWIWDHIKDLIKEEVSNYLKEPKDATEEKEPNKISNDISKDIEILKNNSTENVNNETHSPIVINNNHEDDQTELIESLFNPLLESFIHYLDMLDGDDDNDDSNENEDKWPAITTKRPNHKVRTTTERPDIDGYRDNWLLTTTKKPNYQRKHKVTTTTEQPGSDENEDHLPTTTTKKPNHQRKHKVTTTTEQPNSDENEDDMPTTTTKKPNHQRKHKVTSITTEQPGSDENEDDLPTTTTKKPDHHNKHKITTTNKQPDSEENEDELPTTTTKKPNRHHSHKITTTTEQPDSEENEDELPTTTTKKPNRHNKHKVTTTTEQPVSDENEHELPTTTTKKPNHQRKHKVTSTTTEQPGSDENEDDLPTTTTKKPDHYNKHKITTTTKQPDSEENEDVLPTTTTKKPNRHNNHKITTTTEQPDSEENEYELPTTTTKKPNRHNKHKVTTTTEQPVSDENEHELPTTTTKKPNRQNNHKITTTTEQPDSEENEDELPTTTTKKPHQHNGHKVTTTTKQTDDDENEDELPITTTKKPGGHNKHKVTTTTEQPESDENEDDLPTTTTKNPNVQSNHKVTTTIEPQVSKENDDEPNAATKNPNSNNNDKETTTTKQPDSESEIDPSELRPLTTTTQINNDITTIKNIDENRPTEKPEVPEDSTISDALNSPNTTKNQELSDGEEPLKDEN